MLMNFLEKGLNFLRSYSMRVPMWIRLLLILGAAALPGYWAMTDSGWYATVTLWQTGGGSGTYQPVISFGLPFIFFLLIALAIILILGNFFPEKHPDETNMNKNKLF